MRFFIDTANIDEIKEANELGVYMWSYYKPISYRLKKEETL